jgi:hypothetical protein
VGLLTRLPLLHWFTTELTDGVLCLSYFQRDWYELPRFVLMPGYPALVRLGEMAGFPPALWGRLLAAIFGILAAWPVWAMSRRWASVEASFLATLAFLLSPLAWMWSLRVMPDSMFLFFFWMALERFTAIQDHAGSGKELLTALGCAWVAMWTRTEGFLLLPIAAYTLVRNRDRARWTILFLIATATMALPRSGRFLASHLLDAFREGAVGLEDPVSSLLSNLWVYTTQPAWVFSPILFVLGIGGALALLNQGGSTAGIWRRLLLPFLVLVLVLKMIPTNYQDRHLLVFLPALCVLAAYQLELWWGAWRERHGILGALWRRNALAAAGLAWLLVFSMAVLVFQRDAFGDLKRNAEFLRTLPPGTTVYSDEEIKTGYASGRPILPWNPPRQTLKQGDWLIFHTFTTNRYRQLESSLRNNHAFEIVRVDRSYVLPLLTDLMMDKSFQNRPRAASRRLEPQYFETIALRILRPHIRPRAPGIADPVGKQP